MKNLLLLLPILIFASCKRESEVEKLVLKNGGKWLYYNSEKYNPNSRFISYLKFDEDKCENYHIDSDKLLRTIDGNEGARKWSYSESDSILTIFEHTFKIRVVKTDTLYLYDTKDKTPAMLFRHLPKKRME